VLDSIGQAFQRDWAAELRALEETGLVVDPDPGVALGRELALELDRAYAEAGPSVGQIRLKEELRGLVRRRLDSLQKRAEALGQEAGAISEDQLEARGAAIERAAQKSGSDHLTRAAGRNVRVVRETLGFTFRDFALMSGLSKSAVFNLEKGETRPRLPTVYQLALSVGLHPSVLTVSDREIECWGRLLGRSGPLSSYLSTGPDRHTYASSADAMYRMYADESSSAFDPDGWMREIETAIRKVTRYEPLQTPAAALGAAIGREWAGLYGAFVVAYVADELAGIVTRRDLGGFRLPGPLVELRLQERAPGRLGN
jgi:transcriptional regulator with XRE-family HTH domain